MTETRKAIIELIEPYMDKNIDCGIVIKLNNDYITVKHEPIKSSIIIGGYKADYGYDNVIIIGHYDITAVLKYIKDKKANIDTCDFSIFIQDKNNEMEAIRLGYILLKPLHLYTEQEDAQLLELLLRLK